MSDSRAALDPDRLPWLADDRRPRSPGDWTMVVLWALLATVLVAGVSYWLGVQSVSHSDDLADRSNRSAPAATMRLPQPPADRPQLGQVPPPALPAVEPAPDPMPVEIPGVERARAPKAEQRSSAAETIKAKPVARKAPARVETAKKRPATRRPARLQEWPAAVSAGAHGRMVRVGTFYTRRQAKQGWSRIVRVYPGMRRLRAVVVPSQSLRNGRVFYRLQFGTTSQAHSEVLCQRMRIVALSCVTVGLPGRQAGVRR